MPTLTSTYNDDHTVLVNLEMPTTEYMPLVEKKLKDYRKTVQIKGFRQGQVPMGLLRARFGNSVLFDEISTMIDTEVSSFIKENELYTVGRPIMSSLPPLTLQKPLDIKLEVEIGFIPKFEVAGISPEVTLPYHEVEIPQSEIDAEVERIRKAQSKDFQEGVSDVQEDDLLVISLKEMENGAEKENGLENETTYITVNNTAEDLKAKLLAATVGDKFVTTLQDLDTKIEADKLAKLYYSVETEEGESASCSLETEIEIKEIRRVALKELNQEFFKEITGDESIETIEQFQAVIAKVLKEDQEFPARRLFFQAIYDHLMLANKDLPMPLDFLRRWLNDESKTELSNEEFEANIDDFRWMLIKDQIAKQHDLQVTKEDVEGAVRSEIASYYNYQISPYHPFFDKQVASMLEDQDTFQRYARRILENKVLSTIAEDFSKDIKIVSKEELKAIYDEAYSKEAELNPSDLLEEETEEEVAVTEEVQEDAAE